MYLRNLLSRLSRASRPGFIDTASVRFRRAASPSLSRAPTPNLRGERLASAMLRPLAPRRVPSARLARASRVARRAPPARPRALARASAAASRRLFRRDSARDDGARDGARRPIARDAPVDAALAPAAREDENDAREARRGRGTTRGTRDDDSSDDSSDSSDDDDATKEASVKDLMRFTLPTMAIWLCDPLLSLVDTSVVGLSSGTLELAAIAPGSVYAGYPFYLLATGFAVATTSMVGQDRLLARRGGAEDEDERTVASAIMTASGVAAISAVLLIAAHEPALARYVGSANVALLPYASAYSVIRILALPAGIISAVAQSAFLAVRDPWTPLKAVTLTTVLNLVLDLWFVTGLGWGIAGAAWATSASQVITMALLIRALVRRGPQIDKVKEMLREAKERAKTSAFSSTKESRAVRNVGAPALRLPFKKPRNDYLERLKSIAGPVMMVALIKCIFVGAIVRSATAISPEASAANGVLLTVYFFFAVVGEGVSQAAQAFLPPQLGNFEKASKLAFNIMLVGVVIGGFNAATSGLVPSLFPQMFTKSAPVIDLMNQAIPFMALALFAHTGSMASEGCLLAARDGVFMSLSYVPNAALSCVTLSILSANGFGVRASWIALFQFHCVRLVINAVRLRAANSPLRKSLSAVADASKTDLAAAADNFAGLEGIADVGQTPTPTTS